MENYQNYYTQSGAALDSKVSAVMKRVYVKMFLALLVTAFVSLFCASSPSVLSFFATHSGFIWGVFIVELVLVFAISGGINRMSSGTATMLFFLFAVINGLALFPIFIVYTGVSIAKTFFITAGTFGAMSIYGYFTSQDLSKWGSVLIMALFGLIICSVVNIFWANSTFEWIISAAGVLIFVGLTAWDTQKIKQMAAMAPAETVSKLATIGALSLYLDFINLFLYLLRFFGNSRD
ncbi:MAG: Bax inhibitor-1/YccA family protein [Paramuribaculum sp.]|nr:Bax inhibitor-1/YccA family protein [Paramuribaculum sp.]MDE7452531.1 Bax inhibitor-1/YccA family protein [Paramuribaculum sp.]